MHLSGILYGIRTSAAMRDVHRARQALLLAGGDQHFVDGGTSLLPFIARRSASRLDAPASDSQPTTPLLQRTVAEEL